MKTMKSCIVRRIIVEKKKGRNGSRVTDRRNFTLRINGDNRIRVSFKVATIERLQYTRNRV